MAIAVATAAEAADTPYQPASKTSVGFAGPAGSLWSGSLTSEQCVTPRRRRLLTFFEPRQRYALAESRGELIGEFRASTPLPASIVTTARACATVAGETATTRLMLTGGAPGFSRFQTAFAACMSQHDAAQAVGSMTLWIDNRCNW
ncbi:hypothetical protein [Phenylobacterium sp.]|uniref:hypothetical protein n=1 Tax=Phenylobacterium sp. TaxID=1871053 RepID=UPI002FE0CC62